MNLSAILDHIWKPALGCTEPAAIAYAAALAAQQAQGEVKSVRLRCSPRIFKNAFAAGIPNSQGKTGILWSLAIGSHLPDPSLELECFKHVNADILRKAAKLVNLNVISVESVFPDRGLFIDCTVVKSKGVGHAVIEGNHTNVVAIEKNRVCTFRKKSTSSDKNSDEVFSFIASKSFAELLLLAKTQSSDDRKRLQEGAQWNLAIANYGASQFGDMLSESDRPTPENRSTSSTGLIPELVFFGVLARMAGAGQTVMTAAGSGNKGITVSVPIFLFAERNNISPSKRDEALAFAVLLTATATHQMGINSANCGCTNAAGLGLAAGLTVLLGGSEKEVSYAVNNMVGNVAGMICDGAKIGCALKAMTAVDAALRAARLALRGVCIPPSDGIVGINGEQSLRNLSLIATKGMSQVDTEVLSIMREKLAAGSTDDT